jgi:RNA polymerase sigma-70 factor (ECF subfamily)
MSDSTLDTVYLHHCIDRWRGGDACAADDLLRTVSTRLEALARKMLRSFPKVRAWADTGDVLQNALIRLLRTLQNVKPASSRDFLNLAAVEIRRELLDLARHFGGRRYDYATGAGASDRLAALPGQSESADELELWCRFHEAVEQLSPEDRELISLIFYHDWTQVQIAELFGIAERTVRRRWTVACRQLSKTLAGQFPPVED